MSADTLGELDLFETIKKLKQDYKVNDFFVDEIHFCPGFDGALKKTFDFLDTRVVFTSSSALSIQDSAYDLSRRVKIIKMFPFSFAEFLFFKNDTNIPHLSLDEIITGKWTSNHMFAGEFFTEYISGGLMPFSLGEPEVLSLLKNILEKIVMRDIPRCARLPMDELDTILRLVSFIGKSPVEGICPSSVSSNLKITKYKAEIYLGLLEKCFVLNSVQPCGTNVLKEKKILLSLPFRLLFRDYQDCIGALREDFFVEAAVSSGVPLFYLKTGRGEKTPDYLVMHKGRKIVFEIGGKGKGHEQFKGVKCDGKIILSHSDRTDGNRCPIFMAGFLRPPYL